MEFMHENIQNEINHYLSKKTIYYNKFSDMLIAYLEMTYPSFPTLKSRWFALKNEILEPPICALPRCSKNAQWSESKRRFDEGCCMDHKKRITSLRNFGTEHPNQSKKQQAKVKKSMREKYGVDYVTQSKRHKTSVRNGVRKKYGVDNVLQLPEVRDQIKKTNLERYGFEECMSSPSIREKAKQTNLKRYGAEESLSSPLIRERINKTNLERYGSIFPMRNAELLAKRQQHIIEKYDAYSPIVRKESKKKYFHFDKSIESENNGETYFCFFEDEIREKQKQIEWVQNPFINRVISSIKFKKIKYETRDEFIVTNSLYSPDSEIRQNFGVYSGIELVAVFSGFEKEEYFEISRFVIKIGVGFDNNILIQFINYIDKNKPIIISFDRRFTPIHQPLLQNAGFDFVGGTEPKQYDELNWDCGKIVYKRP